LNSAVSRNRSVWLSGVSSSRPDFVLCTRTGWSGPASLSWPVPTAHRWYFGRPAGPISGTASPRFSAASISATGGGTGSGNFSGRGTAA